MGKSMDEQKELLKNGSSEKLYPDVQNDTEAAAIDTPPAYTDATASNLGPIVNQPESITPAVATAPNKQFKQSLFGCDIGDCLYAWCCPCLVGGDIAKTLGSSHAAGCCMYFCSLQFFLHPLVACLKCVLNMALMAVQWAIVRRHVAVLFVFLPK